MAVQCPFGQTPWAGYGQAKRAGSRGVALRGQQDGGCGAVRGERIAADLVRRLGDPHASEHKENDGRFASEIARCLVAAAHGAIWSFQVTRLEAAVASTKTVSATEFKATCLDLLDRVNAGEWDRVEVTKRGKVVAVVMPPPASVQQADDLHGFMRGSVVIPPDVDLTAPVWDEPWDAELGILHR